MARLNKHQWLEAEELYRQGWTQKQISEKFGIRPEAVSIHMNKVGVKGGESIDVVRQEIEAAVNRKVKEFADKRAARTIDTKEKMHTLINTTLGFFVKELKEAQTTGRGLGSIAGAAKSLKEAVSALKIAREELYVILEIKDDNGGEDAPDLFVMTMTAEEEERIRGAGGHISEEDAADQEIEEMHRLEAEVEASMAGDEEGEG